MSCYIRGCENPPCFSCSCSEGTLICQSHISTHLISIGNHYTTSFNLSIGDDQKPAMTFFIKDRINLCGKLMTYIIDSTEKIIKLVTEISSKTLKEISKKQKRLNKTLRRFDQDQIVEKDIYEEFKASNKRYTISPSFGTERFKELLNNEFDIDIIMSQMREDKYAIFFDSTPSNNIKLLDLDNFSITTESFQTSELFSHCGCLKIGESKYFIIDQNSVATAPGYSTVNHQNFSQFAIPSMCYHNSMPPPCGRNSNVFVPIYSKSQNNNNKNFSARIIDLSNKTSEIFLSNIPSCESGLCLFDEEIFAFGGITNNSFSLKFNLVQKSISFIQGLPELNSNATAGRLKNNIIIGGYNSKKLFIYNPRKNIYNESIFSLLENQSKYIFENLIVCFNDNIYEIDENNHLVKLFSLNYSIPSRNSTFSDNYNSGFGGASPFGNSNSFFCQKSYNYGQMFENIVLLNSSACFKNNNYIHFIVEGPRMYRFKISSKTLDYLNLDY